MSEWLGVAAEPQEPVHGPKIPPVDDAPPPASRRLKRKPRRRHQPGEGVVDTTVEETYSFPDDLEEVEEGVPPVEEPVHGQPMSGPKIPPVDDAPPPASRR
ncbi:hypothetical protein CYMTET_8525 [Cymbomonas tetramitiformis]|uniref:Uncharacterized protein n=1 Tax=Cymbomonas tetramitiformis TaxID=36881 RepID=A0AAE0GT62_9CHLO|nr:hypothetical protein CYMTET_8525 [Cymbomonas tetramitiformis]